MGLNDLPEVAGVPTSAFLGDTVVVATHDQVFHQELRTVAYPGPTAYAVIPNSLLSPTTAYRDLEQYVERTCWSHDNIVMVAIGKEHVADIRSWPDQLGTTAPLSARQLAKPPVTNELAIDQHRRMSFASLLLGPCTVDSAYGVGFQLIIESPATDMATQPCDAITAFLVLLPYHGFPVLKNFLEIFHSQCVALRIMVKVFWSV